MMFGEYDLLPDKVLKCWLFPISYIASRVEQFSLRLALLPFAGVYVLVILAPLAVTCFLAMIIELALPE